MKKLIIYSILSFISFISLGQIYIVDSLKNPISFVQISSNNYNLGYSDLIGKVSSLKLDNLMKDDTLYFTHIAFHTFKLPAAAVNNLDTILMSHKSYALPAVNVTNKAPKYQIIEGCYRSKVYVNGNFAYFSEGKVSYLFNAKNGNYKGLRLNDYVSYQNINIKSIFKKFKTEVGVGNANIPIPTFDKLPQPFIKKHNLNKIEVDERSVQLISEKNILIGKLDFNGEFLEFSLVDLFKKSERNLLNTQINIKSLSYNMIFSHNQDNSNKIHSNFNNLLYQNYTNQYSLQHKNEDVPKVVYAEYEIFIERICYTNEYNKDDFKDRMGMPDGKSRDKDSWDKCDCPIYSNSDSKILIENEMELRTKSNKY